MCIYILNIFFYTAHTTSTVKPKVKPTSSMKKNQTVSDKNFYQPMAIIRRRTPSATGRAKTGTQEKKDDKSSWILLGLWQARQKLRNILKKSASK